MAKNDPYWLTARFTSLCTGCQAPISKGEQAFYYPRGKSIFGKECGCGEEHAADFEAARFDDAQYSGQW